MAILVGPATAPPPQDHWTTKPNTDSIVCYYKQLSWCFSELLNWYVKSRENKEEHFLTLNNMAYCYSLQRKCLELGLLIMQQRKHQLPSLWPCKIQGNFALFTKPIKWNTVHWSTQLGHLRERTLEVMSHYWLEDVKSRINVSNNSTLDPNLINNKDKLQFVWWLITCEQNSRKYVGNRFCAKMNKLYHSKAIVR